MADEDITQPKDSSSKEAIKPNVMKYFDTGQIDLAATDTGYLISTLRGGQAVLIKALLGNGGTLYIGKKDVTATTGFELSAGESIKIEYSPDKVVEEFIELFAVTDNAGDDLCFIIIP